MFLEIDFASDQPIYEQIRRGIIKSLSQNDLEFGETLPSVRQLASDIGVNLHTVNKAYKMLEEDGIIVMDRRFGSKIVDKSKDISESQKRKVKEELDFIIALAKVKNIEKSDLDRLIENIWEGEYE
ncbi:MAG: GntR family transcriptional regulator [Anaerococcus sp.]|uniref:GntR family transcriptional regulator n=2 Tax=Anaerococcus sp. TaxID=1872515 RepID=UPI0026361257|nr:GntR family transcriptional regulator [Anaerococcus sp.]MCI5972231.1 GntR family transcriptional regulator [Anaerococcus sp.]MDD6918078.1 GntR family transcriptional regulator [Peptoniphilaceae bacterium]